MIKKNGAVGKAVRRSWRTLGDSFRSTDDGLRIAMFNKKVQEFANNQQQMGDIHEMVAELGIVCEQSCKELEVELNRIKNEI